MTQPPAFDDRFDGRFDDRFDGLVEGAFQDLWALQPGWAVYLGRHDFDGLVPEWSRPVVEARLARLEELDQE
ncbi:MAG TPA: hypothetical protein VGC11_14135, partial [Acidimicrobiia bacterium]